MLHRSDRQIQGTCHLMISVAFAQEGQKLDFSSSQLKVKRKLVSGRFQYFSPVMRKKYRVKRLRNVLLPSSSKGKVDVDLLGVSSFEPFCHVRAYMPNLAGRSQLLLKFPTTTDSPYSGYR